MIGFQCCGICHFFIFFLGKFILFHVFTCHITCNKNTVVYFFTLPNPKARDILCSVKNLCDKFKCVFNFVKFNTISCELLEEPNSRIKFFITPCTLTLNATKAFKDYLCLMSFFSLFFPDE